MVLRLLAALNLMTIGAHLTSLRSSSLSSRNAALTAGRDWSMTPMAIVSTAASRPSHKHQCNHSSCSQRLATSCPALSHSYLTLRRIGSTSAIRVKDIAIFLGDSHLGA